MTGFDLTCAHARPRVHAHTRARNDWEQCVYRFCRNN